MEALQLLKYSIQKRRDLDFTSGLDWADELDKLEFDAELQRQYPEDARNYAQALSDPKWASALIVFFLYN